MPKSSRKKYRAEIEWGSFEGNRIIVPVCPRSPGVNGRNFEATLKALGERVSHVHILLCDTLDRHNLDGTPSERELKAHFNGSAWLEKHLPLVREHFESYDVRRWNEVRRDPSFKPRLALMHRLYNENPEMRRAVDNVASHYLVAKQERCDRQRLPFNRELEKQNSVNYLLEEFTGDAVYNDWYEGLDEAYWGFYVGDPDIFNRLNHIDPSTDLTIPPTCAVSLNRLPAPIPAENRPKRPVPGPKL